MTRKLIVNDDPKSVVAEAFRTLRTNLQFARIDGDLKTVMFTSAGPGEGKSIVLANTAVAMAQSGRSVIIVDCDLRKPVQYKIFKTRNHGVTNILTDQALLEDCLQETTVENVMLLPAGPIPPNPSELLSSKRMAELLEDLKQRSDIVIVDVPPIIAVTDAAVIARQVDGTIMVLDSGTVKPEMAKRAQDLLASAGANILGVVLNRVEIDDEHAYYYYYGEERK